MKSLLACEFKTFLEGDRIILLVFLEWEANCSILSGNVKELQLQGLLKWFPKLDVIKGKLGASANVYADSSQFFVVFSYGYIFSNQNLVKPKLIA